MSPWRQLARGGMGRTGVRFIPVIQHLESRIVPYLNPVSGTSAYPWNAIVRIAEMNNGTEVGWGSGVMIDAQHVLTAAHVLFDAQGHLFNQLQVTAGQSGTYDPFGVAVSVWNNWEWNDYPYNHAYYGDTVLPGDIAILTLDHTLNTGAFGREYPSAPSVGPVFVNSAGYPGSPMGDGRGAVMYYTTGNLNGSYQISTVDQEPGPNYGQTISSWVLDWNQHSPSDFTGLTSFGGQSGSPIYIYPNGSSIPNVIGVLDGGNGTTGIAYELLPQDTSWIANILQSEVATGTSLSLSANTITAGYYETISATINYGSRPYTGETPTGTVNFYDNGIFLGSASLSTYGNGVTQATFSTAGLGVGTHTITATYGGGSDYLGSSSFSQVVQVQSATSTTIATSAASALLGQALTFTAAVTGASPGGSVTFSDGGAVLGSAPVVNTSGTYQATLTTSSLGLGTHSITATYSGDGNNTSSSSPPLTETINSATTPPPGNNPPPGNTPPGNNSPPGNTPPTSPTPPSSPAANFDELAAYRSSDGSWSLDSNGQFGFQNGPVAGQSPSADRVLTKFSPAGANVIPVSGDWAGIGTTEIGDFVDGAWHLDLNNNGIVDPGETFQFGQAGDLPVPGKYMPGGGSELAVFRSFFSLGYGEFLISDANWLAETKAGQGIGTALSFIFGAAGDRVVVGDWNGAGLTEVGVFRDASAFGAPGAAVVSLDQQNHHAFDGSTKVFIFGTFTDGVVIGDWNGSGTSKVGVYRPATAFGAPGTAVFSLDETGDFMFDANSKVFLYGTPTDKYVTGRWAYTTSAAVSAPSPADLAAALYDPLTTQGHRSFRALDAAFGPT